jgi:hypothetical protein
MTDRDPKQCRERYMNHLDPSVKKDRLSLSEWKTLLEAHDKCGNKWSEIAPYLPGRTANTLKNFWHSTIRLSAVEEIYGIGAYENGSRIPRIPIDDRPLQVDAKRAAASVSTTAFELPLKSMDAMELEDESTSSVSANPNRTNDNSAVSPRDSSPDSADADVMITEEMAIDSPSSSPALTSFSLSVPKTEVEFKPSFSTAAPFPNLWDALVETAMSEYEYETEAARAYLAFQQQKQQQAQQYYMMVCSMMNGTTPIPVGFTGLPHASLPMRVEPSSDPSQSQALASLSFPPSNPFDSQKQFQFWSH